MKLEKILPSSSPKRIKLEIDFSHLKSKPFNEPDIFETEAPQKEKSTEQPVWSGEISCRFKSVDFAVSLPLQAIHISGPKVGHQLPLKLVAEQRLKLNELLEYLTKLNHSNSRNRTCIYFQISRSDSEEDRQAYSTLFNHFKSSQRAGVISIPNNSNQVFKEIFIYPLGAHEEVPDYFNDHYDRTEEDTLIGALITNKVKDKSSKVSRTSGVSPTTHQEITYTPDVDAFKVTEQVKAKSPEKNNLNMDINSVLAGLVSSTSQQTAGLLSSTNSPPTQDAATSLLNMPLESLVSNLRNLNQNQIVEPVLPSTSLSPIVNNPDGVLPQNIDLSSLNNLLPGLLNTLSFNATNGVMNTQNVNTMSNTNTGILSNVNFNGLSPDLAALLESGNLPFSLLNSFTNPYANTNIHQQVTNPYANTNIHQQEPNRNYQEYHDNYNNNQDNYSNQDKYNNNKDNYNNRGNYRSGKRQGGYPSRRNNKRY